MQRRNTIAGRAGLRERARQLLNAADDARIEIMERLRAAVVN